MNVTGLGTMGCVISAFFCFQRATSSSKWRSHVEHAVQFVNVTFGGDRSTVMTGGVPFVTDSTMAWLMGRMASVRLASRKSIFRTLTCARTCRHSFVIAHRPANAMSEKEAEIRTEVLADASDCSVNFLRELKPEAGLAVLVVLHGLIEFVVRPRVEVESH
jgi:hypothetical protein